MGDLMGMQGGLGRLYTDEEGRIVAEGNVVSLSSLSSPSSAPSLSQLDYILVHHFTLFLFPMNPIFNIQI